MKFKPGDKVKYTVLVCGEPVTTHGHQVEQVQEHIFGDVAWITGVATSVLVSHLKLEE